MTVSVTGKLNKAANIHLLDSGDAIVGFKIGKKEYDRKNKKAVWVNYSAGVYVKANQLDFYQKVTGEGSVVCLSGTGVVPRTWTNQNTGQENIDLEIVDANMEQAYTGFDEGTNAKGAEYAREAAQSQPKDNFEDDIPFS